jgi:hypothetical protein
MTRKREEHPIKMLMAKNNLNFSETAFRFGISERQLKKFISGEISIPLYIERLIDLGALGRKWKTSSYVILVRAWEKQYCIKPNSRSRNKEHDKADPRSPSSASKAKKPHGKAHPRTLID